MPSKEDYFSCQRARWEEPACLEHLWLERALNRKKTLMFQVGSPRWNKWTPAMNMYTLFIPERRWNLIWPRLHAPSDVQRTKHDSSSDFFVNVVCPHASVLFSDLGWVYVWSPSPFPIPIPSQHALLPMCLCFLWLLGGTSTMKIHRHGCHMPQY